MGAKEYKLFSTIKPNRLFENIPESDLDFKINQKDFVNYNEGDIIFQSGDSSDMIFLIVEGRVKIKFNSSVDGQRYVEKSETEFFGEKEFIQGVERNSAAVADTDVRLFRLHKDIFNQLIEKNKDLLTNLQGVDPSKDKSRFGMTTHFQSEEFDDLMRSVQQTHSDEFAMTSGRKLLNPEYDEFKEDEPLEEQAPEPEQERPISPFEIIADHLNPKPPEPEPGRPPERDFNPRFSMEILDPSEDSSYRISDHTFDDADISGGDLNADRYIQPDDELNEFSHFQIDPGKFSFDNDNVNEGDTPKDRGKTGTFEIEDDDAGEAEYPLPENDIYKEIYGEEPFAESEKETKSPARIDDIELPPNLDFSAFDESDEIRKEGSIEDFMKDGEKADTWDFGSTQESPPSGTTQKFIDPNSIVLKPDTPEIDDELKAIRDMFAEQGIEGADEFANTLLNSDFASQSQEELEAMFKGVFGGTEKESEEPAEEITGAADTSLESLFEETMGEKLEPESDAGEKAEEESGFSFPGFEETEPEQEGKTGYIQPDEENENTFVGFGSTGEFETDIEQQDNKTEDDAAGGLGFSLTLPPEYDTDSADETEAAKTTQQEFTDEHPADEAETVAGTPLSDSDENRNIKPEDYDAEEERMRLLYSTESRRRTSEFDEWKFEQSDEDIPASLNDGAEVPPSAELAGEPQSSSEEPGMDWSFTEEEAGQTAPPSEDNTNKGKQLANLFGKSDEKKFRMTGITGDDASGGEADSSEEYIWDFEKGEFVPVQKTVSDAPTPPAEETPLPETTEESAPGFAMTGETVTDDFIWDTETGEFIRVTPEPEGTAASAESEGDAAPEDELPSANPFASTGEIYTNDYVWDPVKNDFVRADADTAKEEKTDPQFPDGIQQISETDQDEEFTNTETDAGEISAANDELTGDISANDIYASDEPGAMQIIAKEAEEPAPIQEEQFDSLWDFEDEEEESAPGRVTAERTPDDKPSDTTSSEPDIIEDIPDFSFGDREGSTQPDIYNQPAVEEEPEALFPDFEGGGEEKTSGEGEDFAFGFGDEQSEEDKPQTDGAGPMPGGQIAPQSMDELKSWIDTAEEKDLVNLLGEMGKAFKNFGLTDVSGEAASTGASMGAENNESFNVQEDEDGQSDEFAGFTSGDQFKEDNMSQDNRQDKNKSLRSLFKKTTERTDEQPVKGNDPFDSANNAWSGFGENEPGFTEDDTSGAGEGYPNGEASTLGNVFQDPEDDEPATYVKKGELESASSLRKSDTFDSVQLSSQESSGLSVEQLRLIIEAAKTVNSNVRLDEALKSIVVAASNITKADRGTLYIIDRETDELWSKVMKGQAVEEIRLKIGQGLAGWVAKEGKEINLQNAYQDERFDPHFDSVTGYRTTSMLCYPIKDRHGNVTAVLQLLNSMNGSFRKLDEEMISALSSFIAISLENAELVEKMVQGDRLLSLGKVANFIISDIKKPILTIKHLSEHLRTKKDLPKDVRSILKMILDQSIIVGDLILTTLNYSQGKVLLNKKLQKINPVMDEMLGMLQEAVEYKKVQIFKKYDRDVLVMVDRKELYQAFFQITKNACDAMPGGGKLEITTKVVDDDGTVEISFKDSGMGIPEAIKEKLFEPFFSQGKKNGIGLGLPITEKIIREHGGTITVESELGEGANFIITLPQVTKVG